MSVIPPPSKYTRASFSLPHALLDELEHELEEINATRDKPDRFSRDRLVQVFLEWAIRQRREEAKPSKKRP